MSEQLDRFVRSSIILLESSAARGRYCQVLSPSDNSPLVVHERTNQLTYVAEGEGVVRLNGIDTMLVPGSHVFIEAGVIHGFKATSERFVLFHIHVPNEGRDEDRRVVSGNDYERFEV